jgi:hypothetical protein
MMQRSVGNYDDDRENGKIETSLKQIIPKEKARSVF